MIHFALSLGFLLLLLLSCHGWGRWLLHRLAVEAAFGWAYCATLGVAVLIFLGGLLNLFAIAKAPGLWGVLVVGLLFSGYYLFGTFSRLRLAGVDWSAVGSRLAGTFGLQSGRGGRVILLFLIVALLCFYVYTLMPAAIFNHHDDLGLYLTRPLSMIWNGTLAHNNTFKPFPVDSLGGHAYMQAFFLLPFDIEYVNGFDVIFCFFLSIALVWEMGRKINMPVESLVVAVTLLVVWNPIYVNTSALYAITLLMLGLVVASMEWFARLEDARCSLWQLVRCNIPFALLIAALGTLKATALIFATLFYFIHLFCGWLVVKRKAMLWAAYALTGWLSVLLIAPWLWIYKQQILIAFHEMARNEVIADAALFGETGSVWSIILFNNFALFWGGRVYWYLVLGWLAGLAVVAGLFNLWKSRHQLQADLWTLPLVSLSLATLVFYFVSPLAFPWGFSLQGTVRYATPFLLAMVPLVVFLVQFLRDSLVRPVSVWPVFFSRETWDSLLRFAQGVLLVLIGVFWIHFIDRLDRMADFGHMMVFGSNSYQNSEVPKLLALTSEQHKNEIRSIQAMIPAGATVLAWIGTPFQLDFGRNRIEVVWSVDYPLQKNMMMDVETGLKRVQEMGVEYVLWQFGGFPVTSLKEYEKMSRSKNKMTHDIGQSMVHFIHFLEFLRSRGETIYLNQDNQMMLFKIK